MFVLAKRTRYDIRERWRYGDKASFADRAEFGLLRVRQPFPYRFARYHLGQPARDERRFQRR